MKKYFHKDNIVTAIQVGLKFNNIHEIKEFIKYDNRSPLWTPDALQLIIRAGSTITQGDNFYASNGDWIVKKGDYKFVVLSNSKFSENYMSV